VAFSNADDRMT